jgi:hypothetical protein
MAAQGVLHPIEPHYVKHGIFDLPRGFSLAVEEVIVKARKLVPPLRRGDEGGFGNAVID